MSESFNTERRRRRQKKQDASKRPKPPMFVGLEALEGRQFLSTVSIGSLVLDNPTVTDAGSSLTITASNIVDSDASATLKRVKFYADVDGDGDVTTGNAKLLGSVKVADDGSAVLTIRSTNPGKFPIGSYKIVAVAVDNQGDQATAAADINVVARAPQIKGLEVATHRGTLVLGSTNNTLAVFISDPDHQVATVAFYVNQIASGVVDSNSELITGTLTHHGSTWVLTNAVLPDDVTAGSNVEIVAQATGGNGQNYILALGSIPVAAAATPAVTKVQVPSNQGTLVLGSTNNTVAATVSDPDHTIQTVDFFANTTASGAIDANSIVLTGTLDHFGKTWVLENVALPAGLTAGATVELVARATDANGQTYLLALDDVSVVAAATPVVTKVQVPSNNGGLVIGSTHNIFAATVTDKNHTIQAVKFYVNQTATGVVDSGSEEIAGTIQRIGKTWALTGVTLPANLVADSTVEIIAQATDSNGQNYILTLDGVSVSAAAAASISKVEVVNLSGSLLTTTHLNALAAKISDPDHTVTTVKFYINQTATGVVDAGSEALTGTLTRFGAYWVLSGVVLPSDVAVGSSVEIIAQATDANGQTYVQTLDDVSVVAPPSFHGGHLLGGLLGH